MKIGSQIDEVGAAMAAGLENSRIKITIEGQQFVGDVIGSSAGESSDYQTKIRVSGNNIITVYTDIIQETSTETLDHYRSEAYIIHNNEKQVDFLGIVTGLEVVE